MAPVQTTPVPKVWADSVRQQKADIYQGDAAAPTSSAAAAAAAGGEAGTPHSQALRLKSLKGFVARAASDVGLAMLNSGCKDEAVALVALAEKHGVRTSLAAFSRADFTVPYPGDVPVFCNSGRLLVQCTSTR